ncbi:YIP1 family protein [Methanoplanus sp. FWC-SCC4]|uniref:YIP1 family protein n=1 Tax=Methanochimaera problematica TaxID=2609417 RepID=A0AA97I4H5_9EURY|nr:YIP1 family protein [Methanoplanus sp. FWC-SCC4]WOF16946.1 YIP1 family protein [Methanoplanus sp. FWC-SCC4]
MNFDNIIEKAKGFILEPVETFRNSKDDSLSDAFGFFAVLLVLYSVLFGIMVAAGIDNPFAGIDGFEQLAFTGAFGFVSMFVFSLIGTIVATLIGGLILHLFVYIVGGRKGLSETIKAVLYSSTPSLLFGWIPVVGIIFGVWSLILEILGIRELHEISTGRSLLAVLLPVILFGILLFAIIILGFFFFTAVVACA